jgi:alpha-tubulin suppressor-like RCC1 family protein
MGIGITDVECGENHAIFKGTEGGVYGAGNNIQYQLGRDHES